jgi:glycosyltransferase involved in cell wall biosynthesis
MLYTSRLEPFGLAPLEANACGTPVVAIAEGGVRETIQDGVNGFVAADDDPVALGRLVSQLTSSPARADELGRRALAHVRERWGVSRSIDEIERHLREVVAAGASREP